MATDRQLDTRLLRWLFRLSLVVVASTLPFFRPAAAFADGTCGADPTPFWDNQDCTTHFIPIPWPSSYNDYTHQGLAIQDPRGTSTVPDTSNGGRTPQNYANISSSCTASSPDLEQPSVGWYFDSTSPVGKTSPTLFFNWRVEQIPNNYATGPAPGAFSAVNPFFAAQWTVLIDIDGDGFREFAANVAGMSGTPSQPIDILQSIYSNTRSQSVDFYDAATGKGDPNIHLLFHNPTAFVDRDTSRILNFNNTFTPTADWPNGSAERVWDYGSTRVQDLSTSACNEYSVDYQIPLAMLDATSVGGPRVTEFTPMCFTFVTANSNENPLQKDVAFNGTYTFTPDTCVPCGDLIVPATGQTIPQPVVDLVTATGCGPTTLTARVRDAIGTNCQDTLASVEFLFFADKNANGDDDDLGVSWTPLGSGVPVPGNPGLFTYNWNTQNINLGQYLVGVKATDDQGNITWSYLTAAEAAALGANNFANPTPEPGVLLDVVRNSCGESASLAKSVSPAFAPAGSDVVFTITVTNDTSAAFTVTSISDTLPDGFSYQSNDPAGDTLTGVTGSPTVGATGTVSWSLSGAGASVAARSSKTFTFTAQVSAVTGTYTNTAGAVTNDPDWGSLAANPVDIGVGAPALTILKTSNVYSVLPGDTILYTITYSNDSPVNASGVTITDTLPTGLEFMSASGGGAYDTLTRTVTWNLGGLASMEGPYTVGFEARVNQGANARTANTATIDANETSPAASTTAVLVQSPLVVEKTADKQLVDPAGLSPANQVTFTIAYRNTGSSTLTNVIVSDTTMPGFTYVSNTGGGTSAEVTYDDGSCGTGEPCTVTWPTIASLAAGSSGSVSVTLDVVNPYSGSYPNPAVNTASVASDQLNPITDAAEIGIKDVDCQSNPWRFYFKDLDASVLPYPYTSPNTIPAGVSPRDYARKDASPVSPMPTTLEKTLVENVEIELAHFYMDPPLSRATGFSITGNVDIVQVYYDKDGGPQVSIQVYIYDYDPVTGLAVQIGSQATGSGTGAKTNQLLPTLSIVPSGIVDAGHLMLFRITATAANNYNSFFRLHFDGTSNATYGSLCFAPLSINLQKSVDKLLANAGDTLQYTLAFANTGANLVTGAQIVDSLPSGVSCTTYSLNGGPPTACGVLCAGTPSVCTFNVSTSGQPAGTLAAGATGSLVINAQIAATPPAGVESLTNSAELRATDIEPIFDEATTDLNVSGSPDVFLQKSADKTLLFPGDTVTYTVTAANVGKAAASSLVVTDILPADTYFTYVANSLTVDGVTRTDSVDGDNASYLSGSGTITWSTAALASGATTKLTFQMHVASSGVPTGVTTKDNTATATEATTAPPNSNTVRVSISTNANLSLTKAVSLPEPTIAAVGTGDDLETSFDTVLSTLPVQEGSVRVFVAGVAVGVDSGTGAILGTGLTAATIDYATGALHLEFLTPPADGAAIAAESIAVPAPGEILQFTMTLQSTGGGDANGVVLSDPIPAFTTYVPGSLILDGDDNVTDAVDGDAVAYDPVQNRVRYTPGTLSAGATHTLTFSVVSDIAFTTADPAVTNTATAAASNAASKQATAAVDLQVAPELTLSKSALPGTLPYPPVTATWVSNAAGPPAQTTLSLPAPTGVKYVNAGDWVFTNGTMVQVLSIDDTVTPNRVTVSPQVAGGALFYQTVKYTLTYTNSGSFETTNVRVKDILPANLVYLKATPTPTTAPVVNTNGYINWSLGTLAPGAAGTLTIWARPTADGTYLNTATMDSREVPEFTSNQTTTTVGAITVDKTTTTATVVNSGGTTASYTIVIRNPLATAATGITVTDYLPAGFTYASTLPNPPALSGAGGTRTATVNPAVGSATPSWGTWTLNASGGTLTITFTANIDAKVEPGTYQNAVEVSSTNKAALLFDETATLGEDVKVTIPGDIAVFKQVAAGPIACTVGGVPATCVDYLVTATNVGTSAVTSFQVTDADTDDLTYPPANLTFVSATPSQGAYAGGVWTFAGSPPGVPNLAAGSSLTLALRFRVDSFTTTINNCARRTASTPPDTNSGNDRSCAFLFPTQVILSSFGASVSNGRVVVEWTTASERDTAGFFLHRLDPTSGEYLPLHQTILPAVIGSPQGGTYRFTDVEAHPGETSTYLLVEAEVSGARLSYGPFTVRPTERRPSTSAADRRDESAAADGFERIPRGPTAAQAARLAAANNQRAADRADTLALDTVFSADALKLPVDEDGLHYVSAARIATLMGLDGDKVRLMIRGGKFALSLGNQPVAYLPADVGDGLYFYGRRLESIFSDRNVYWLMKGQGLLMQTYSGVAPPPGLATEFTETVHAEEDLMPVTASFMRADQDFWFWGYLVSGYASLERLQFPFRSPSPASTPGQANLTVHLHGMTTTGTALEHHALFRLNGIPVGEAHWEGTTAHDAVLPFDQGLLNDGENTLEVEAVQDSGVLYSLFLVDSFDVRYLRRALAEGDSLLVRGVPGAAAVTVGGFTSPEIIVLDLADALRPRVNGTAVVQFVANSFEATFRQPVPGAASLAVVTAAAREVVPEADRPSDLRKRTNRADYLVIAPDFLLGAAEAFAGHRRAQGFESMTIDIQDVYDEFSGGIATPEALRGFLRHAAATWRKSPRFVLLLGDGTLDFKDNLGYGENLVPALLVDTPMGLAPADGLYGDLNGDHFPEIAVGRIPVITAAEAAAVLAKIVSSEGLGDNVVVLLSDKPDAGGNYAADARELTSLVPAGYQVRQVPLESYSLGTARSTLFSAWHEGTTAVAYVGHGGVDVLSFSGLLRKTDVPALWSEGRLPVVSLFTCMAGEFAIPGYDSLSEALLLGDGTGAVAVWSPSGMSYNSLAKVLSTGFFRGLFSGQSVYLGDAVLQGLAAYRSQGGALFMMDIYNLMGDPAQRVR